MGKWHEVGYWMYGFGVAVFDVFPIANELDILEVRLETLKNDVDFFVAYEWSTDYRGGSKRMYLGESLDRFRAITPDIVYVPFTHQKTVGGFDGERIQRDEISSVLNQLCSGDDVVIYSDIDEIPRPESLQDAVELLDRGYPMVHFAQDFYMYYFNLNEVSGTLQSYTGEFEDVKSPKWLGSRILQWRNLNGRTMSELRYPETKDNAARLSNAGWHFSWVGNDRPIEAVDRVLDKVRHYHSHLEQLNWRTEWQVRRRVRKHQDVWGRPGVDLKVTSLESMPFVIRNNPVKYSYALLPYLDSLN